MAIFIVRCASADPSASSAPSTLTALRDGGNGGPMATAREPDFFRLSVVIKDRVCQTVTI